MHSWNEQTVLLARGCNLRLPLLVPRDEARILFIHSQRVGEKSEIDEEIRRVEQTIQNSPLTHLLAFWDCSCRDWFMSLEGTSMLGVPKMISCGMLPCIMSVVPSELCVSKVQLLQWCTYQSSPARRPPVATCCVQIGSPCHAASAG
eukprot:SAG31_NODE_765_length_12248_cov_6.802947_10_plen_147_part_00